MILMGGLCRVQCCAFAFRVKDNISTHKNKQLIPVHTIPAALRDNLQPL